MDNKQLKKEVKKRIPKDWLCDLRIAYRIIMETFNDIVRSGVLNFIIITTTMVAILTIFGVLLRFTFSLSALTEQIGNVLEISVYLRQSAQTTVVKDRIKNIKYVKSVKVIPKENSWKEMKAELGLHNVTNPLPDTLKVKVDKPENIKQVQDQIKMVSGVEDLGYAKELAERIQTLTKVVNTTMIFVILISAALTITIINNTIHLVIQSRKEEIEIMRLMGVSNWYIKTPLIIQGAFYGFISSIIAVLPLKGVQGLLMNVHKFFSIPSPQYAQNVVIATLLLIGITFGAIGSFMAIKKHLQV